MPEQADILKMLRRKTNRLKQLGSGIKVGKVCGDRVLVKTVIPLTDLDEYEKKGIALPEGLKEEYTPLPSTGIVLETGAGIKCQECGEKRFIHDKEMSLCERFIPPVSEGDMILFPKVSGMDIQIADQDLRIIRADDILCVLVDEDNSVVEVDDGLK